ncbi:VCBS repeat-containing protein, partial [Reichenbachiella sp. MALMAid0571]|uniref:FG-GAP repeat domain-containing protein n=1 Tax=Reichenbachiella sp. MALMAid0571 TaxID=3143939 RepID=UPI0032DF1402
CLSCSKQKQSGEVGQSRIGVNMFEHHYVTQDLPGEADWGYGCPAMADFDRDGDLDYAFTGREGLYWFENQKNVKWIMHEVGVMPLRHLGATNFDVDKDGWEDIIIGGFWYRNPQNPKEKVFERYQFDETLDTNIHDIVMADMDGSGEQNLVLMGEGEGVVWYEVPEEARQDMAWKKSIITLDALPANDHIHSGFFPKGVDDLDGDGDNDLVLPDRWLENKNNGTSWEKHQLPFGKRGPFGLSSRSWIVDLDKDGDNDIVMTDSDQQASRAAWLENHGNNPPDFTAHFLPMTAPGIRGSFHSLYVGDFDNDGDQDIFTCDQEDDTLPPEGAFPRWYIWENVSFGSEVKFIEKVIYDGKLGGHDALVGDVDGDGD